MSATEQLVLLDKRYSGGFVALAYVVAVVGSWSTVELLLKRTGNSGWYNASLLVGAGVAFGTTATWGMHFVGNQAVTLHLPGRSDGIALSYSVGFTVLSLFVALLSMIIAFSFIGLRLSSTASQAQLDNQLALEKFEPDGDFELERQPQPNNSNDQDSKRFSWAHQKPNGSTVVNLPGKLARPNSTGSLTKAAFNDDDDDMDRADDGGEFGMTPAKLSIVSLFKILIAGVVCGGGVAGMHYVGQLSINTVPRVGNKAYMVVLSILIAMIAVSVALYLLFAVLRPKLQHAWYKRLGVALLLAVATTLMHFVALMGTTFYAIEGTTLGVPASSVKSKKLIIALVSSLAPLCCVTLLAVAYIAQQRLKRQIASRHRIVLAVAIFDSQGMLLVNHEDGMLPSAQIYPTFSDKPQKSSFLEWIGWKDRLSLDGTKKLSRSDPAFIAFLRASWSWRQRSTKAQQAAMANVDDLEATGAPGDPANTSRSDLGDDSELSDLTMEQMRRAVVGFEIASQEIATNLIGVNNVKVNGVLFDSILKTGHFQVASRQSGDKFTVTQGQLLVLTRRLRLASERDALLARGFTFAEPKAVSRVTASALAVPVDRVFDYFRHVHRYSRYGTSRRVDRGRLYGGVLILQAQPGEGLHVVVDEKQHHALPMIELAALIENAHDRPKLPPSTLPTTTLASVADSMRSVAGRTLLDLIRADASAKAGQSAPGSQMQSVLVNMLRPFLDRTLSPECMAFLLPRLVVTPQVIPLTDRGAPHVGADGILSDSFLICLKAVIPSAIVLPGPSLEWLPFALYKAQSECITRATGMRPRTKREVEEDQMSITSPSIGTGSPHASGMSFPPSSGHGPFPSGPFSHQKRGSISHSRASSDAGDDEESAGPSSLAGFSSPSVAGGANRERDPNRPLEVPSYDDDWVLGLVKTTVAPQEGQGYWGEVSPQQLHGAARRARVSDH